MTTPSTNIREYDIAARSTDIFGRVLCSARTHHFIVDGPVQNGCPGEALTPAEIFLSGIAACSIELMHVIARNDNVPLEHAQVHIHGLIDRDRQARTDVTLFNSVQIAFELTGPSMGQGTALVEGFKRRCPLYGTLSVATADVAVSMTTTTG